MQRGSTCIGRYACTCCGYTTISDVGGYEICTTCFWEDDDQDVPHTQKCFGGPNHVSFLEARRNFLVFGAVELKARRRGMYGEEVA
jgi:hypothetical protein